MAGNYPIHDILKKYWGYDTFRPMQEEIILSVLSGIDTLAILPTGGGKSICFQVPALVLDGICIVISPLIALMKDQADQLKSRGISAVVIHSGMHQKEIDIVLDNCIYGGVKFLYVSPERLLTEIFLERAKRMNINLLAIDETHCISEWGYDFRPAYLQIKDFREQIKPQRNIALTASAIDEVKKDIVSHLDYSNPKLFVKSFRRENLSYSCLNENDKEKKLFEILNNVKGSSVVYVRNRRRTKDLADLLRKEGIQADFYHAGLSHIERSRKQDQWIQGKIRVIVSTNAFGMGIDKPDVRTVIHMDLTNSLEAYYQEAGRGGRDGKKAYAVILYDQKDIEKLKENLDNSFPGFHLIRHVYQSIVNHLHIIPSEGVGFAIDFDLNQFVKKYELDSTKVYAALKILEKEGILQFNEAFFSPSKLFIPLDNKRLYEFQVANANFDIFIKTILRMYGGELFSHFITINESQIAEKLDITLEDVLFRLKKLNGLNVFEYAPQKESPQITLMYSGPVQQLPISEKNIRSKHEREIIRTNSVIDYVENLTICRSVNLCMYFGEMDAEECGICDICLEKKRKTESILKSIECKNAVIELFKMKDQIDVNELPSLLKAYNKELVMNTIRELLDEEKLTYSSATNLVLKR